MATTSVVRHHEQTGKIGNPHAWPQSVGELTGETTLQNGRLIVADIHFAGPATGENGPALLML